MTVYLVFYVEGSRSFLIEVFATEELATQYVSGSPIKYVITPWEVVFPQEELS
jgi:hypothetical protein